jgi:predicted  nucleic acid-binding Zn-ribbon protein
MPGVILGALVVGIPTAATIRKQSLEIEDLKQLIEKQSETVTELAETVKKAEHTRKKTADAEEAKKSMMRKTMGMDSEFLSEFNRANGWR